MADRSHKADWLDRAPMDVDLRKRVSRSHAETIQERAAWLGEADEAPRDLGGAFLERHDGHGNRGRGGRCLGRATAGRDEEAAEERSSVHVLSGGPKGGGSIQDPPARLSE